MTKKKERSSYREGKKGKKKFPPTERNLEEKRPSLGKKGEERGPERAIIRPKAKKKKGAFERSPARIKKSDRGANTTRGGKEKG